MADEPNAVNRLEEMVALAGRIYVPPHIRIRHGKKQHVDGYWRSRRPGEKGNVAALPAGVRRAQPEGRNARGKRAPNGGIDAGNMRRAKDRDTAVQWAVDDLVEMEVDKPTLKEAEIALKQRLPEGSTPNSRDVATVYARTRTRGVDATQIPQRNRFDLEDRAGGGGKKTTLVADLDFDSWADETHEMGGGSTKGVGWLSRGEIQTGLRKRLGRTPNMSEMSDAEDALRERGVEIKGGPDLGRGAGRRSLDDIDIPMVAEMIREETGEAKPWINRSDVVPMLRTELGRDPSGAEVSEMVERLKNEQIAFRPSPGGPRANLNDSLTSIANDAMGEGRITRASLEARLANLLGRAPTADEMDKAEDTMGSQGVVVLSGGASAVDSLRLKMSR